MKKLTICVALALSALTLSASSPYGFKDVMTDPPKKCWRCDCYPYWGPYCCYEVPCN